MDSGAHRPAAGRRRGAHRSTARSKAELPARAEEAENAEEEGVIFDYLTLPGAP